MILCYITDCEYMLLCRVFFFFKQKTAYEMRISDWSSDVCSSDLGISHRSQPDQRDHRADGDPRARHGRVRAHDRQLQGRAGRERGYAPPAGRTGEGALMLGTTFVLALRSIRRHLLRSEEHTSELQSLMRISYAVFCLKKKTKEIKDKEQIRK